MRISYSDRDRLCMLRPLVASLAIALSLETSASATPKDIEATASTSSFADLAVDRPMSVFLVENCNDSGTNSLRDAVAAANMVGVDSAVEFDINNMHCSTISLTTGEIEITLDNLEIDGPDSDLVTIDGGYVEGHTNRIIRHVGHGSLHLDHLLLRNAAYSASGSQPAKGGCVYSSGNIYLSQTRVESCMAEAVNGPAAGGAVWGNSVKLVDSVVTGAAATSAVQAFGGGVYVKGAGLTSIRSTIANNSAVSYSMFPSQGGGAYVAAGITGLQYSTLSGNQAQAGAGLSAAETVAIANSTIAFNFATIAIGGMVSSGPVAIYNSTIAENLANYSSVSVGVRGSSVTTISSIVALNADNAGVNVDVQSDDGVVAGSNNLIGEAAAGSTLPADTIRSCPRLSPPRDNGGPTHTLALLPGSPAINTGANPFDLADDQRGAGFPRIVGPAVDIGAYEWSANSGDEINRDGFDLCG